MRKTILRSAVVACASVLTALFGGCSSSPPDSGAGATTSASECGDRTCGSREPEKPSARGRHLWRGASSRGLRRGERLRRAVDGHVVSIGEVLDLPARAARPSRVDRR